MRAEPASSERGCPLGPVAASRTSQAKALSTHSRLRSTRGQRRRGRERPAARSACTALTWPRGFAFRTGSSSCGCAGSRLRIVARSRKSPSRSSITARRQLQSGSLPSTPFLPCPIPDPRSWPASLPEAAGCCPRRRKEISPFRNPRHTRSYFSPPPLLGSRSG